MAFRDRLVRGRVAGLVLLVLPLLGVGRVAADTKEDPAKAAEARMRRDDTFLASDKCEGRGCGTVGLNVAADYIADQFKKAGLKPGGKDGSYFQPFTTPGGTLEGKPHLALTDADGKEVELKAGKDYNPLGVSPTAKVKAADLVFAGYGISFKTGGKTIYDDYDGLDVKGKVVVVLRGFPREDAKQRPFGNNYYYVRYMGTITQKCRAAAEHGAVGVLLVNDYANAKKDDDPLLVFSMTSPGGGARVPAFQVKRAALEPFFKAADTSLVKREEAITKELKPQSVALKGKVAFDIKTKRTIDLKNVIGVLEGKGPLADETVVVGAHYDHLGWGQPGSLAGLKKPAIHRGADDNGSGTTAIIELARRFAARKDREGRRLVFMLFSGEELGLHGSKYYCAHPIFPLKDTVAMVNLDMVGRLRPDRTTGKERLLSWGVGTAKTFNALVDRLNQKYDFTLSKVATGSDGYSDHSSFYAKKVPILFFWTDVHAQYHKPTDSSDTINFAGMVRIVGLAEEAIGYLTTVKERPEYVNVPRNARVSDTPNLGMTVGQADKKEGLPVTAVAKRGQAEHAGVKPGDRVTEVDGKEVRTWEEYHTQLVAHSSGDPVKLSVLRDGKKKTIAVTPGRMPRMGFQPKYGDDQAGVLVEKVTPGGPADKAGIKDGDRITQMGGKKVDDLDHYMVLIREHRPGDTVEVAVLRNGKTVKVKVKFE
jgi:hypothetical protein